MRDSEIKHCHHGGSICMSRKQKKSAEEKVKIIRQYQQGEISISQAAELGEVDFETAKEWIRNYESEGVSAFLPHNTKS